MERGGCCIRLFILQNGADVNITTKTTCLASTFANNVAKVNKYGYVRCQGSLVWFTQHWDYLLYRPNAYEQIWSGKCVETNGDSIQYWIS